MNKTEYINGSDLLIKIGEKCVGHCTSGSISYSSETKERAVKPVESAGISSSLWKNKGVTGLSVTISFEGLRFYEETENGYEEIASMWGAGESVAVQCIKRGETAPYLKGNFVISSLEESAAAQDDATYSGSMENDGMPETYPGKSSAAQTE